MTKVAKAMVVDTTPIQMADAARPRRTNLVTFVTASSLPTCADPPRWRARRDTGDAPSVQVDARRLVVGSRVAAWGRSTETRAVTG